jgi:hypothetical protein
MAAISNRTAEQHGSASLRLIYVNSMSTSAQCRPLPVSRASQGWWPGPCA